MTRSGAGFVCAVLFGAVFELPLYVAIACAGACALAAAHEWADRVAGSDDAPLEQFLFVCGCVTHDLLVKQQRHAAYAVAAKMAARKVEQ